MFDIYKLFYFVEETGLLIQEKWYKATHPQIWERNLRKYGQEEQEQADENISGDISGVSNPELTQEMLETGNVLTETKDSGSGYRSGDKTKDVFLCPAFFRRDYTGNPELNEEDCKNPENR